MNISAPRTQKVEKVLSCSRNNGSQVTIFKLAQMPGKECTFPEHASTAVTTERAASEGDSMSPKKSGHLSLQ